MKDMVPVLILTLVGLAGWPGATVAEDTDLFMAAPPGAATANPNVLIILDNSANWSASLASDTKFDAEIAALDSVLGGLTDEFNVGLMLFGETGGGNSNPVTSYMRYAVRTMNSTNKPELQSLITGLDQNNDKGSNAPYGLGLFETFKYFGGGGTLLPSDATHYGPTAFGGAGQKKRDYSGNPDNAIAGPLAGNAFISGADIDYESPIADGCAKNYVIYLSNGLPQSGADNPGGGNPNAQTLLQNVGGNITTIPLSNNTAQGNIGDEYARFLYGADVSSLAGQQNISTYTIFTHDPTSLSGNDNANIVLLQSMANQGHGKYFAASDTASLIDALKTIFNEIQSVNEVFAAVSLPVSANVQGTSLNQVYMGVFRPDPDSFPRWMGNLKEYQLIVNGGNLYLGDKNGIRADNPTNGFITDNAVSYWTSPSTFWNFSPSGNPLSGSDSPDGPIVEKGAAAQRLRESFAASQATRALYTCTGACPSGLLSGTPFNTTTIDPNSASTQTAFGVTNPVYVNPNTLMVGQAGEVTDIINWVRGADNNTDENGDGSYTDIRASIHGDVVHSRPAVINYNGTGTCAAPNENDVYVFYGANDGVFHALKGGKGASDGVEKWGFIPPEFYGQLKRLRDNAPANTVNTLPPADTSNNKSYFADGAVSVYQVDANGDCKYTVAGGDKVHIFVSMRRGGRLIYALDVTDPDSPRMLWKITNSTPGFAELGYTWSIPAVALVNLGGTTTPVLVFGGGYDAVEDVDPDSITGTTTAPTVTSNATSPATTITRNMGRGIFVVKASDGSLVWSAGGASAAAVPQLTVTGMDFALPSDVTVLDTNLDGVDDRFYVGDTGGKVWRADIGSGAAASWAVTQLAAIAIDSSSTARRKFLYPPVVVAGQEAGVKYHAVLIGSGDREHPFNTTVANRFYMFKDSYTGLTSGQVAPITEADLFNATNALPTGANSGWRIDLATGEKVVSGATVLAGSTFFNTNIPPAAPAPGVCSSNLGTAHLYAVGYADAAGTLYNPSVVPDDAANLPNKFTVQPGGSFQPPPVPVVVELDGKKYQGVISGTNVTTVPGPSFGARLRTYWYEDIE